MTEPREKDALVAATTSAWRPRDPEGRILAHPAWHDLDDEGRLQAYEETRLERALEAALDPRGLTTTARAVLARIYEAD